MLQVSAVLPGMEAARIRIGPVDALSEVGQRSQRGTGRVQNSAGKRIRQRIDRGSPGVVCGDKSGAAAETVLAAGNERGLRETSEAATDDRMGSQLVSETDAGLDFLVVRVVDSALDAIDAVEELRPVNFE